jgi:hypothetical protein
MEHAFELRDIVVYILLLDLYPRFPSGFDFRRNFEKTT